MKLAIGTVCDYANCKSKKEYIITTSKAWKGHCTTHHGGVWRDAEIYDPANEPEEDEEQAEDEEAAADPVVEAINELKQQMSELTMTVTMLAKAIHSAAPVSAPSTPMKVAASAKSPVKKGAKIAPPAIKFEGIADDEMFPVGKLKLNNESIHRVVYNRKEKLTYYSPKKETGELTPRPMNQVQMQRMEALTSDELEFLGFEEN